MIKSSVESEGEQKLMAEDLKHSNEKLIKEVMELNNKQKDLEIFNNRQKDEYE